MKKFISILFIIVISSTVFADSGKSVLKKIRANYENIESLELFMHYELYKGHKSNTIVTEYNAVYNRIGKDSYRKIQDAEVINSNTEGLNLTINHNQRAILVGNSTNYSAIDFDVKSTLKHCKDIQIRSNNKNTIITLVLKDKTDIPYVKVEFEINKKYYVQNIIFYYSTQLNFSETYFKQDFDFPKLKITYNALKKKWKDKTGLLSVENYVKINDDNKIVGIGKQKNYEIIDLRKNINYDE